MLFPLPGRPSPCALPRGFLVDLLDWLKCHVLYEDFPNLAIISHSLCEMY